LRSLITLIGGVSRVRQGCAAGARSPRSCECVVARAFPGARSAFRGPPPRSLALARVIAPTSRPRLAVARRMLAPFPTLRAERMRQRTARRMRATTNESRASTRVAQIVSLYGSEEALARAACSGSARHKHDQAPAKRAAATRGQPVPPSPHSRHESLLQYILASCAPQFP
jgi:hypothetical protein